MFDYCIGMTDSSDDDWFVRGRQTDLNWAIRAPVAKPIGGRSRLWQFGDKKELRKRLTFFNEHTSLHGIHFACSKTSKKFWSVKWLYK